MDNVDAQRRARTLSQSGAYRYLLPENLTRVPAQNSDKARCQFRRQLAAWVASHGPEGSEERRVAASLAAQIRYVPLPEFYAAFDRQLEWLNKSLKMPYQLIVPVKTAKRGLVVPSSTSWLGQRVIRTLRAPLHGMIMSQSSRYIFSGDSWPENVVYADDGTYSATQITEFVRGFVMNILLHRLLAGRMPKSPPDLNVWFAIPFRTPHGDRILKALGPMIMDELASKASAFTDAAYRRKYLAAIATLRARLKVHVSPSYEAVPSALDAAHALSLDLKTNPGAGTLLFEHKAPDWLSFPTELASGCRIVKRTGGISIFSNVDFKYSFDCRLKSPIVSQGDPKPYHMERPGVMRHLAGGPDDMRIP